MKKTIFLLVALAQTLFAIAKNEMGIQVKVQGGTIEGTFNNGLFVFKGIPFAAPPTGDLRWKAPQPVKSWSGIKKTIEYGPSPIQMGRRDASEDCLYLNVWTPAKQTNEKLPVMVWIYGGGFTMGSTNDALTDGEALANKGVILVSIAYRVGRMGFFAHPELSKESPNHVSGNYGILDQIAGLQWVHDNIAQFGGDPNKVTIFGESAGGISVSMLCASPLTKGLISGAICESGGSFGPARSTTYPGENMKTLAQAEADGTQFAEKLGTQNISELRAMEASKFLEGGMHIGGGWPIVDGYVIPGDQFELYEQGKYNDIPVMIGYNSDEGASFGRENNPERYKESVRTRYGKFADDLLRAYPIENDKITFRTRGLTRDAAFGWHTWSWARLQTKTGKSKVFLYYFDQHTGNDGGSPHGQEIQYVFQHINRPSQDSDIPLMKAMGEYWTNFAKYGNPNGKGVPQWPVFNNDKPQAMHLTGPTPFAGAVQDEQAMKELDKYFAWRRTNEGKAWAK